MGELFVGGGDLVGGEALGAVDDGAGSGAQAVPLAVRVAEVLAGTGVVEDCRLDGRKETCVGGNREVAGVDGHVDVGLGVFALCGDPLPKLSIGPLEEFDVDVELIAERLEGGLEVVVAAGVDLDRAFGVAAAARCEHKCGGRGDESEQKDATHEPQRYRQLNGYEQSVGGLPNTTGQ